MRTLILVLLAACMCLATAAADQTLNNFSDISQWKPNLDGGHPPAVAEDHDHVRDGGAMRIAYSDQAPHWGNLTGPCKVPADALALRLWVYRISAAPNSELNIWLFEPDGDAWLQQVTFDGKTLGEVGPGWHEARLPISGFRFQARGKHTRQMTQVNRMLIGCNYGNFEVTLADMTWETGPAAEAIPLPKTEGLRIEKGARGSVGILDLGENLPDGFKTANPPAKLADAVRAAGFGATILKAGDLADPAVLTRDNFDAVILPCGPYFPQAAKAPFIAYLKAGGSFLSTDGYAFDKLVVLTADGWSATAPDRTAADMDKQTPTAAAAMNTRLGQPGDAMSFQADQIGVFDPQFELEYATQFRPAAWMKMGSAAPTYDFAKPVTGFAACGLIGWGGPVFPAVYRRWIPILNAYDARGGGLRGAALAEMHNFAATYKGSSWAFSGLTDGTDIFLGSAKRRALLARVLEDITAKVYLHELKTDFACYEKGETAHISVQVSDFGRLAAKRTLTLTAGGKTLVEKTVSLQPGETTQVTASLPVDGLKTDYCPVVATLHAGSRVADVLNTAFCIRDEKVLESGPKLAWHDNYFTVDGRPTFMIGSNQTGMMFYSAHETPAIWNRDFADMAEHNFHVLRILHFSPFAKNGYKGDGANDALDLAVRPKRLVRQLDAIVQLAQKHHVVIFLSLHDWMPVQLSDKQLKVQADWDRFWAERYRNVPGVIYDIQNEPNVGKPSQPDLVKLWNQWLKERYGDDAALKAAWRVEPPEAAMPNVPMTAKGNQWDNVRVADLKRFESVALNRWVKSNMDGIVAGNPNAIACVGYLPDMGTCDKILGTKYTDFSNMHYYGATDGFATAFKIIDRRFVGKGLSIGECGAQEAHGQRTNGDYGMPVQASVQRFDTYLHYAVGMGAAYIGNWDWKDFDEMVFPWGLLQTSSRVTKPWLHTWEEGSLFVALAEPVYQTPTVFLLVPDQNRIGPEFDHLYRAILRSIDLLLDRRVNFDVANEEDIDKLPAGAKVMYWPLPYCPTDATFAKVLDWVKAGGTLYLSGDVQFDATRQPTRADRLAQLGLPVQAAHSPFDEPEAVWGRKPIETNVGKGKVLFAPYPLELRARDSDGAVYARALAMAGVEPIAIEPADAPVRALSLPTHDGGRLYMLARKSDGDGLLAVTIPAAKVTIQLAGKGFAFVVVGQKGEVRAAESQGAITVGGKKLASAKGYYGVCALDGMGLANSREVLVLPHQCEAVNVSGMAGLKGESMCIAMPAASGAAKAQAFDGTATFSLGTPGEVAIVAPTGRMDAARKIVRDCMALRFAGR